MKNISRGRIDLSNLIKMDSLNILVQEQNILRGLLDIVY